MPQFDVELRTLPGFAQRLDIGSLHYGLILQERVVIDGTRTQEFLEFQSFVPESGAALPPRGVKAHDVRNAQERGEETELDLTLVRPSAMRLDCDPALPFGKPTLQRVYVAVLARKSSISPNIGLALHVTQAGTLHKLPCADAGAAPMLLWAREGWEDADLPPPPNEAGDLTRYLAQLRQQAEEVVAEQERKRSKAAVAEAAAVAQRARTKPREPEPAAPAGAGAPPGRGAAASPPPPPAPAPAPAPKPAPPPAHPPTPMPPPQPAARAKKSNAWGLLSLVLFAAGGWYFWNLVSSNSAKPPAPAPAPTARVPAPATPPPPAAPAVPAMPSGNSPTTLATLYSYSFPQHLVELNAMLKAAANGDRAEFDARGAWLAKNKELRNFPKADAEARRAYSQYMDNMVNNAKAANDVAALERSVDLIERFLQSHYGYSSAHLALAIAQVALNRPDKALPPAVHTVVFNPNGANGYVALAVALARKNDIEGAAAAFCTVLRKVKYSERTVTFFEKIARGGDFDYPGVADAMKRTDSMCPRERWGVEYAGDTGESPPPGR